MSYEPCMRYKLHGALLASEQGAHKWSWTDLVYSLYTIAQSWVFTWKTIEENTVGVKGMIFGT